MSESLDSEAEYRSRRLVLKRMSPDEVQHVADELGWPRKQDRAGEAGEIEWVAGPATSLHYQQDYIPPGHGVAWAQGTDKQIAEAVLVLAEKRLDTWRLDELLAAVDNAEKPVALAHAVIRAGLGSPREFDELFFTHVKAAMAHSDTRVRQAAFFATTYPAWPQFLPLLDEAARNDPDEKLRHVARTLANMLKEGAAHSDPDKTEASLPTEYTEYTTKRMLLRDDSSPDLVPRLVREITKARKMDENFRSWTEGTLQISRWEIVPGVKLYYAEDVPSESACVVIGGHSESGVSKYENLIQRYLRPPSDEALLALPAAASDDAERARAILRVGFGSPSDFDDRFYSVIQGALFDPSTLVRKAAVQATQYLSWPEYSDCLRRVAAEDPDPALRRDAAAAAAALPDADGR